MGPFWEASWRVVSGEDHLVPRSARTKRLSFCISPKDSLPCLALDSQGGQELAQELGRAEA